MFPLVRALTINTDKPLLRYFTIFQRLIFISSSSHTVYWRGIENVNIYFRHSRNAFARTNFYDSLFSEDVFSSPNLLNLILFPVRYGLVLNALVNYSAGAYLYFQETTLARLDDWNPTKQLSRFRFQEKREEIFMLALRENIFVNRIENRICKSRFRCTQISNGEEKYCHMT